MKLLEKASLLIAVFTAACVQAQSDEKGLKDYYANYFPIGVAVYPGALKNEEGTFIAKNFASLTAENAMKSGPIHPKENEYFWKDADSIVAFSVRNKFKVRGHTLVWHNQTPKWLFVDSDGKNVSKDILLQRMRDHIHAVVGRYKGKIYAWDVVNEAVSDNPDEFLRPSLWYQICGEEFIEKAFQYAHEADPDALLFYNDYNEIDAGKREKIIRLINNLKAKGIPIHGIGLQGHWSIYEPTKETLEKTLGDFSKTGLTLQITELDISVYAKEHSRREPKPGEANSPLTKEQEEKQTEVYKMCFELFRKYQKQLSGVTFWNVSDKYSWLDDFPVRGRKDYPLLFDKSLKPKNAFWAVTKF
jgi:endo-1,4-beta-xylanase